MFRPAKIYHTVVILNEDKVNELINKFYEIGICELKEAEIELSSKYSYELVKELDETQTRFNFIVDSLEEYKEVIQPGSRIKQLFFPEAPKKHKSMLYSTEEVIEEVKYHLGLIEPKIVERLERLQKINEQKQKNDFIIANLSLVPDIKTNIFKPSDDIKVFLGIIANSSLPKIREELKKKAVIGIEKKDKNRSFLIVFTVVEEMSSIEKVLHAVGFERIDIPYEDKKPTEIINNLKKEVNKLEDEKRSIDNFLAKTQKVYEKKFELLGKELEIAKQKVVALKNFKTTEAFSVLEAWVPKKELEKFHETIKETTRQYYIEIDEKEDAPALLINPLIVKPFEKITEMYSLPKYKEFDPTPIVALTFSLFFGFVVADFFYGLLIVIAGIIILKGKGKYDYGAKNIGILISMLGASTIIAGIIFGSYFGNFFQTIGIKIPYLIDPMSQVITLLLIALGIGLTHISTGLVIGLFENLRKGKILNGLQAQGVWLLFVSSIICFILKLNITGIILVLLSVVLQISLNFKQSGFAPSLISVFSFAGFVGDNGSYARLMALSVSSSGIALAFNLMSVMAWSIPFIGPLIAVLVFIVGHLFNLLIASLGGFVHPLRLHFLEHFSKYYEGGGRRYTPFGKTN